MSEPDRERLYYLLPSLYRRMDQARHAQDGGRSKPRGFTDNLRRWSGRRASSKSGPAEAEDMVAQHFKSMAEGDGNDPKALAAFIQRKHPPLGPEELAAITNPTLVVIGEKDFAGPAEPLVDALPNAELLTLPGVDHFGLPKAFPFLERGLDFLGAAPF